MTKFKVLDLFAGIGGFSLGLERTGGFETVAFCEIDKAAQKVLRKHWKDVPIFEDVKTLKGEDVGTVDVITGGFPCQDISVAGKGAGLSGERSGLWWEYHRIIKETQPKYVIAENVSVLRSRGLDQILRSLSEIGYDAEWHCITASSIGAPHRRDRIWIVAYPASSRLESLRNWITKTNYAFPSGVGTNTNSAQCERRRIPFRVLSQHSDISRSSWWEVEPNVGRVANGVSGRVDRLKQLGNAVVPQIPELIGRAILMKENKL
jgi:DNA (cytosine-5)-methyltransferase 1